MNGFAEIIPSCMAADLFHVVFRLAGHKTKHEDTTKKQFVVFSRHRLARRKHITSGRNKMTKILHILCCVFAAHFCRVFPFFPTLVCFRIFDLSHCHTKITLTYRLRVARQKCGKSNFEHENTAELMFVVFSYFCTATWRFES